MNQFASQQALVPDSPRNKVGIPAALPVVAIDDAWLTQAQWRSYGQWLIAALAAHLLVLLAIFFGNTTPPSAPQIMSVSLLPMAPPAPTPPAPQPKTQPVVVKKTVAKATITPKPTPTTSETAISQAQVAATTSTNSDSSSTQAASGSSKPSNDQAFSPAHDAAYLNNPRPAYPAMSRRLGEQGKVMLEVHVLANGTASKVSLAKSSGFPRLDDAAVESVKRWRFVPAKQGNEAIAQIVIIPMPFVLEK